MTGGASQCDLFDYKPLLIQKHGQVFNPGTLDGDFALCHGRETDKGTHFNHIG